MQEGYNIRLTLGGIGMLIYGMVLMEEGIRKLVKSKLQQKLEKYTKNKGNSFLLGVGATALTQSSSLISLLLLVFVGAGIIALPSAIAVIIGSNIGTTFTSLLVARLGFGKYSITAFAFPLIAISGIALLFVKNKKRRYIFKILMSFGLIFFGIDLIKESVEGLKTLIDFSEYAHLGVVGFFIIGVLLTAIIQSSHTVVIMTLAALHGGIITFPLALGIVIGSNIGTTVTVIFASLGGSKSKKQVAFAHLGFNLVLSLIGLLYYPALTRILIDFLGISDNPVITLAVFNTFLNALTAGVVLPFLGQFVAFIRYVTDHKTQSLPHLHIQRINTNSSTITSSFPGIILHALTLDAKHVLLNSCQYILQAFEWDFSQEKQKKTTNETTKKTLLAKILSMIRSEEKPTSNLKQKILITKKDYNQGVHKALYESLKKDIEVILPNVLLIEQDELSPDQQRKQQAIETTINYCIESMKHIKSIREDLETLRATQTPSLQDYYQQANNELYNLAKTITMFCTAQDTDIPTQRQELGTYKSLYKVRRTKSKHILEELGKDAVDASIPLSTLFNIERQFVVTQKYLIKAWKAYLTILYSPKTHSGYKVLLQDLYDEVGEEEQQS